MRIDSVTYELYIPNVCTLYLYPCILYAIDYENDVASTTSIHTWSTLPRTCLKRGVKHTAVKDQESHRPMHLFIRYIAILSRLRHMQCNVNARQ